MNLRKAAEQALNALDRVQPQVRGAIPQQDVEDAIDALRAALAEPDEIVRQHEDGTVTVKRSSGWRQCAKGQKTTQYCGLLEEAVKAEREACARVCELIRPSKREYDHRFYDACTASAAAIRTRGNDDI